MSTYFEKITTHSGEGGVNPSGQPDRFFPVFFTPPLKLGQTKKSNEEVRDPAAQSKIEAEA